MNHITLKGVEHSTRLPAYPVMSDLVGTWSENQVRTAAAAVGLCVPKLLPPRINYVACSCNPLVFGGAVMEWAYQERIPNAELFAAGTQIMAAVVEHFEVVEPPSGEEIEAAEDFSEAPAGSGSASRC